VGQTNDKQKSRPGRSSRTERQDRFNASRFVQCELDDEQQRTCKAWQLDESSLLVELVSFTDDGYSITFRWDTFSDSYACWLQIRGDATHINAGLILSGRGSSPAKAFKQAIFKHRLMEEDWRAWAERPKRELDD